ncbi:Uncharacterised protein [Serratia marcescens]|uniref:PD-(D/E)XK nuclease domain-containing protein n=1 Tax=Serratia TaxID=613 RepID=UPI0007456462|nr:MULTISPECIES: hypothetical protein [Serratia]CUY35037.1 Uncharacterised protein [Serratia marcescens]CUY82165.1 Uncharacterised protein [Serratia marcescens]CUY82755.1 Uncharacterised protein [Serratia marcescens]CUY99625.1 Uncharacterised protein [Serratia marcescens]CUZ04717.1 Uncharacterised protein [Serratia marcescens]
MSNSLYQTRYEQLDKELQVVLATKTMKYSSMLNINQEYVDSEKYKVWVTRTQKLIADSYGKESDTYNSFVKEQKGYYATNYEILSKQLKPVFDAAKADLAYSQPEVIAPSGDKDLELIISILKKFPAFCRKLKQRYSDRATIEIKDEYDVQDLVHALLTIHFDDIRPEEYTPSFAGASSRQDFLLKKEKIVIEVKKTRKTLGARQIGEELITDMTRYRVHPDCETLVCFVYDPEGWVSNPSGLITDLEAANSEGKVRVVIAQF